MAGKRELVAEIMGHNPGVAKKDVEEIVTQTFKAVALLTKKGEKVIIKGFGTFEVKHRREKKGRNPQTGEDLMMAARDVLTLKEN